MARAKSKAIKMNGWGKQAGVAVTLFLACVGAIWSFAGHDYRIGRVEKSVEDDKSLYAKQETVTQKFDMISYQIAELGKQVSEIKGSLDSSTGWRGEVSKALDTILEIQKFKLSDREGGKR